MPKHPDMSYDEYDAEQSGDSGYALPEPIPLPVDPPAAATPPAVARHPAYNRVAAAAHDPAAVVVPAYDSASPSPDASPDASDSEAVPTYSAAEKQVAESWNACSSYMYEYMDADKKSELNKYAAAIRAVRHGDISVIPRPTISRDDILMEFAMLYASAL